tara:strand:+ start:673 stop:1524 length:852 start_codon:yes stop_codon:yes gene_type:complete
MISLKNLLNCQVINFQFCICFLKLKVFLSNPAMLIKKYLSFCFRKFSDIFYDLSLFLKKQSTLIFPFTSINNLDKQISKLIPNILNSKTFYIEVGANDGITQSNTFFLEKKYNAKGMLIEASPSLYEKCFLYRSEKNIFENYALVSPNFKEEFVQLIFGNLWTTQENVYKNSLEHAKNGVLRKLPLRKLLGLPKDPVYKFFAPAITLNKLIEKHSISYVDFLSLDVEGSELSILQGCNLEKGHIKNILIETFDYEAINRYLIDYGYSLVKKLSNHDYLFTKIN